MENFVIPKLREDLSIEVVEHDGEKFVVLSDPALYARQPVPLPIDLIPMLQIMNGKTTTQGLIDTARVNTGQIPDLGPLLSLVNYLDQMGFLETEFFYSLRHEIESYKKSSIRKPVCSGNSYLPEEGSLRIQLEAILSSVPTEGIDPGAEAIIVPHIDFLIGEGAHKAYASGYQAIRDSKAELFVIFGTSHFGHSDIFMLTEKDFETPLGIVETDKEIINTLKEISSGTFTIDDMAHYTEHSIELQLVLLQQAFEGRDFTILPVLVGSYYGYINSGSSPVDDKRYIDFLSALRSAIGKSGKETVYIASADMAHVGRKFEDDFDAEPMLPVLKDEDTNLIESLCGAKAEEFYQKIASVGDHRKICGLPPIYALLNTIEAGKGVFLDYKQWNERETKSAVSFASLAYYK